MAWLKLLQAATQNLLTGYGWSQALSSIVKHCHNSVHNYCVQIVTIFATMFQWLAPGRENTKETTEESAIHEYAGGDLQWRTPWWLIRATTSTDRGDKACRHWQ